MVMPTDSGNQRPVWFVNAGAGRDEQTERFLAEGTWENIYGPAHENRVMSIMPGDSIIIKHTFICTDRSRLPFDNRGRPVSVMEIKAIGTVTDNIGDGHTLSIDWIPVDPPRLWCFFTAIDPIWPVRSGNWHTDRLLKFAFGDQAQNIDEYLSISYWGDRYGDSDGEISDDAAISGQDVSEPLSIPEALQTYPISNILDDGCFLDRPTLDAMLERLRTKQNLILQGPPGTGKTWLAKRLAYALIGRKDDQ